MMHSGFCFGTIKYHHVFKGLYLQIRFCLSRIKMQKRCSFHLCVPLWTPVILKKIELLRLGDALRWTGEQSRVPHSGQG